MQLYKRSVEFYLGGAVYMTLEFLWRGRSAGSMFLLGGTCFLLLGRLGKARLSTPGKALCGTAAVTALELLAGFVVNRDYSVWDYRRMPLNFRGQICLPYSLLWMPLSLAAMLLYQKADRWIDFFLTSDTIKENG